MNHIIKHYDAYNERRYSTPWAAPCDSTGRPNFKGRVGHFTGGHGEGGDLFVEDPREGSVWAYGQKDYRGGHTEKSYAQFARGKFHPVSAETLLEALASAEQQATADRRKDELLHLLFARVSNFEGDRFGEAMQADGITKAEAEAYGVTWED